MQNLFEMRPGVQTRWFSPENETGEPGRGGIQNQGAKGRPSVPIAPGESTVLMDLQASGTICRIWLTVSDRSPQMLRSLRIDMFWDGAEHPAVSAPLGDFFGVGLGLRVPFECALFSDPEGRSFNCFIPMPFRSAAKITITNESEISLGALFYDIDVITNVVHSPETLYFHAYWNREMPNQLGEEYSIVPYVHAGGRFLGCNVGVITDPRYEGAWWGEGEVKSRFHLDDDATLCGTGTEDYIGTAWGQGAFAHRTQGSPIADSERGLWAFYRYHIDDPIFFEKGFEVDIQTLGGCQRMKAMALMKAGVPLIPVTIDPDASGKMAHLDWHYPPMNLGTVGTDTSWCNFWRQDDWSSTAYLYLDKPNRAFPALPAVAHRIAGLPSA